MADAPGSAAARPCGGVGHTDTPPRLTVPRRCDQELCPNWSGDGDVCPCAIFDLPRPVYDDPTEDAWFGW